MNAHQGYLRHPTLRGDTIVFVSDDDLWVSATDGGVARRLTAGLSEPSTPCLSPDGQLARLRRPRRAAPRGLPDAGRGRPGATHDVARARRHRARLDAARATSCSSPRTASRSSATTARSRSIRAGGMPQLLPLGQVNHLAFGPGNARVIGRNTADPARWKRYRGGTAGHLWIDAARPRQVPPHDRTRRQRHEPDVDRRPHVLPRPMPRASATCTRAVPDGRDLVRHTDHDDFYARHAQTDGRRIVYQCGAELWLFDPASDRGARVDVACRRTARRRRAGSCPRPITSTTFDAASAGPQHRGRRARQALRASRCGKARCASTATPTAALSARAVAGRRQRRWWRSPTRSGEERVDRRRASGRRAHAAVGRRPRDRACAPRRAGTLVAHRQPPQRGADRRRRHRRAHGRRPQRQRPHRGPRVVARRRLARLPVLDQSRATRRSSCTTSRAARARSSRSPSSATTRPSFDPAGRYLYFLSLRTFDPVYDSVQFELSFPRAARPYLIALQAGGRPPFEPAPKGLAADDPARDARAQGGPRGEPPPIELAGIERRIAAFPVPESRFGQIAGVAGGKVVWIGDADCRRARPRRPQGGSRPPRAVRLRHAARRDADGHASTSSPSPPTRVTLVVRDGKRLRAIAANRKPEPERDAAAASEPPSRKSGWIDLDRIRVSVEPRREWRQMLREVWRLQRDQFWVARHVGHRLGSGLPPLRAAARARRDPRRALGPDLGDAGRARHVARLRDGRRPPPAAASRWATSPPTLRLAGKDGSYEITRIVTGDPWDAGRRLAAQRRRRRGEARRAHRRGQRPADVARTARRRRCSSTRPATGSSSRSRTATAVAVDARRAGDDARRRSAGALSRVGRAQPRVGARALAAGASATCTCPT